MAWKVTHIGRSTLQEEYDYCHLACEFICPKTKPKFINGKATHCEICDKWNQEKSK